MRLRSGVAVEQNDKYRTRLSSVGNAGSISGAAASVTLETTTLHSGDSVTGTRAAQKAGTGNAPSLACANKDNCPENTQLGDDIWKCLEGTTLDNLDNTNHIPVMANTVENHVATSSVSTTTHARQKDALLPHNKYIVLSMKIFGFTLVLFFFIIPAFIKIYPAIVVDVAFLNHLRWPPFINLNRPAELGLNYTRDFKLDTTDGVTVGAWHILPEELAITNHIPTIPELSSEQYRNLLQSGNPIILYLHGNAGTRAGWHRVQLYKVLSKAGFHVVTFDYRGYGDSTGLPSEEGLVRDSVSVFKWLRRRAGNVPIYIWGHSLGSGVATETSSRLCKEGANFNGLVLESPFTNFVEAASNHPFSLPFRVMPWFSWVFIEAIKLNNIRFESDKHINGVTVPVIILHAIDDVIVPYELGRKLYEVALRRSPDKNVEFVTFDGVHGYGHKHIHKSPQLVNIIRRFTLVDNSRD